MQGSDTCIVRPKVEVYYMSAICNTEIHVSICS